MKKILFILVILSMAIITAFSSNNIVLALSVSKEYYKSIYDNSIYNSADNIYNSTNQKYWGTLIIGRPTGYRAGFSLGANTSIKNQYLNQSWVVTDRTTITGGSVAPIFDVKYLDNGNILDVDEDAIVEIVINQTFRLIKTNTNWYEIYLDNYDYRMYYYKSNGDVIDISYSNYISPVNGTTNLNFYASSIPLRLLPDGIFISGSSTMLNDLLYNCDYWINLNYINSLNSLYYQKNTAVILGISGSVTNLNNNTSDSTFKGHANYGQGYVDSNNVYHQVNVYDGYITDNSTNVTSDYFMISNYIQNNYDYQTYFMYNPTFYVNGYYRSSSSVDYMEYRNMGIAIYANPLYGSNGSSDHTSGLISFTNNYYKTPSNWFDILTHLYNFLIFIVFDMPLISDIIEFFGNIVNLMWSIFQLLLSFTFNNVLILSIVGLFCLVFILRLLL